MLLTLFVLAAGSTPALFAAQGTPESAVRGFISAAEAGDLKGATQFVEGAKPSDQLAELEKMYEKGKLKFEVSNLTSSETGDDAKVTFDLTVNDFGRVTKEARQTLSLHRKDGAWRIVPVAQPTNPEKGQEMAYFATLVANADGIVSQAKKAAKSTQCLSNLKQLATGCLLFLTDNDDKLLLNTAKLKTKVMPYVKSDQIFLCPESGQAYAFNDNITGRKADAIKDPANTVLAYEGSKGALDFRHDGRACVAFLDGHCKLVNREQAKSLIWKP